MAYFHRKDFDREKEREKSRKVEEENRLRDEYFVKEKERKAKMKRNVIGGIIAGIIIVLVISASVLAFYLFTPGKYDSFAKCLTEKGAVMYGENWCKYTNAQKNMFGKSFKYINYQVKEDLNKRPTWVINGETYETVQSFERLSALTGCKI